MTRTTCATVLMLLAPSVLVSQNLEQPDDRWQGVERVLAQAVREHAFPGAVLVVGLGGKIVYSRGTGHFGDNDPTPVTDSTIYDLASLTKVVGLTTAVMLLVAHDSIDLDAPVSRYLPEFHGPAKDKVSVRHLLTHTSGLPAWRPFYQETSNAPDARDSIIATPLEHNPGDVFKYSDIGAIILGMVVERITHMTLDRYLDRAVFVPLQMAQTRFRPPAGLRRRIAPTEADPWRGHVLRGEVHDENAARLGGVAGHAGLFSTGPDLAKFAFWLLDSYHGRHPTTSNPHLPAEIVREFVARQPGPKGSTRALGWDTPSKTGSSAGSLMPRSSFGHTGFTGTSMWIDPDRELFIILLTNRVHPTRENNQIRQIRPLVADAVLKALAERNH
ncbi:MAG: serine hydrolase domain-containing protein [Gemmatimonadales bacterium]